MSELVILGAMIGAAWLAARSSTTSPTSGPPLLQGIADAGALPTITDAGALPTIPQNQTAASYDAAGQPIPWEVGRTIKRADGSLARVVAAGTPTATPSATPSAAVHAGTADDPIPLPSSLYGGQLPAGQLLRGPGPGLAAGQVGVIVSAGGGGRGSGLGLLGLAGITGITSALLTPKPSGGAKPSGQRFLGPPVHVAPEQTRYVDTAIGAPSSAGPIAARHPMPWDATPPRPVHAPAPAVMPTSGPPPLAPGRTPGGHIPPPMPPTASSDHTAGTVTPWEGTIGAGRLLDPTASGGAFQAHPIIAEQGPTTAPPAYNPPLHPVVQIAANWLRGPARVPGGAAPADGGGAYTRVGPRGVHLM